jgi:hypothetical protein
MINEKLKQAEDLKTMVESLVADTKMFRKQFDELDNLEWNKWSSEHEIIKAKMTLFKIYGSLGFKKNLENVKITMFGFADLCGKCQAKLIEKTQESLKKVRDLLEKLGQEGMMQLFEEVSG